MELGSTIEPLLELSGEISSKDASTSVSAEHHLFNHKHVPKMTINQQPEQLRPLAGLARSKLLLGSVAGGAQDIAHAARQIAACDLGHANTRAKKPIPSQPILAVVWKVTCRQSWTY